MDEPQVRPPRFTRDEQALAVWVSHTVIPIAVVAIVGFAYGKVPIGFIVPEVVIWIVFSLLSPSFDAPAVGILKLFKRDEYLIDVEAFRHRALPAAFTTAFVLQFVALTFLLAETGGPITSPFASFVIAYTVFSSLLTTKLWSLGVALIAPTIYYTAMVAAYGSGSQSDRASEGVYLAVTLFIIWLTVWLAFLSRLSMWRLQSTIDAEADLATVRAAVAAQIWSRGVVTTRSLPARRPAAEAALAEYRNNHPELALHIVEDRRLKWVEQERMAKARALTTTFTTDGAAELFAESFDLDELQTIRREETEADSVAIGAVGDDPVLPSRLFVRATAQAPSGGLLEETARIARQEIARANVAVLLVEDATEWLSRPEAMTVQRGLSTSVVVMDAKGLMQLAGATSPRRALMSAVREQADLSKANPFVVLGPTPPPMFFGRHDEEVEVSALLGSNSAALLGGRRTGKTSLLKHIKRTLSRDEWTVLYADLQSVSDWDTFADLVADEWQVDPPKAFRPSWIGSFVREVRARNGGGPIAILLDEVDQFLRWDLEHENPLAPEVFFRSCRTLSQEGAAQFVLAGERTIAGRLWSPDSPHWNFCRPIPVRQLARKDADQLLVRPLAHLEVGLADTQALLDHAWRRTSGHPRLVQFLGGELVGLLNERDPEVRGSLSLEDVKKVTESTKYRDEYVDTYRGQSTPLERSLCNLAAAGVATEPLLSAELNRRNVPHDNTTLHNSLRMLDLYGILRIEKDKLVFRAEWMPEALQRKAEVGSVDPGLIP
ncbi:MAG: AAA family ATPase [Solirubrobacterales bacterium]